MLDDDNLLRTNTSRIKKGTSREFNQPFKLIGLRDKYFAYIIKPLSLKVDSGQMSKNLQGKQGNVIISLNRANKSLAPGQSLSDAFLYYCGPQQDDILAEAGAGFEQIRNFGKLDVIVKFLLKVLGFIYGIVHNWGVVVIIFGILVYFCLYPLTLKQMHSMKKMQALQPEMEALKTQYKDNPQKFQRETMGLYKKHHVNPLGGCLPLVAQMPIFFSVFQAMYRCIGLKGARFLWIKDLSGPDRLFIIGGKDINLLPILMMAAMFLQQKLSMRHMSSSQSEQQKMMLWIFPLMFGFFFYNMPSGLVLYWFINSILMIVTHSRFPMSVGGR